MPVWVVRAGANSEIIDQVKKKSLLAIGWSQMEDCSACQTREDFRAVYLQGYPDDTNLVRQGLQSGQVYRFAREIKVGDFVMTPNSPTREMLIGEVIGEHRYDPTVVSAHYPNVRSVKWLKTISRDDMPAP
jgi:restriction system protein